MIDQPTDQSMSINKISLNFCIANKHANFKNKYFKLIDLCSQYIRYVNLSLSIMDLMFVYIILIIRFFVNKN